MRSCKTVRPPGATGKAGAAQLTLTAAAAVQHRPKVATAGLPLSHTEVRGDFKLC